MAWGKAESPGRRWSGFLLIGGETKMANVINGTEESDGLSGTAGDDEIFGLGGNDSIHGGNGNDTVDGGDGDDFVLGGAGDDIVLGGAGNDFLKGGLGVDHYDGGTEDMSSRGVFGRGGDRITFSDARATAGVIADLRTGIISNDGYGNAETMVGIESLGGGTPHADQFYGNEIDNLILSGIADTIMTFGGNDWIQAEGAAAVLDGGDGIDTVYYAHSSAWVPDTDGDGWGEEIFASAGMVIDLLAGTVTDGYGYSGTIAGFENIITAEFNDIITGDANANILYASLGNDVVAGGAGNDTLVGIGDSDSLDGGEGTDSVDYSGNVFPFDSETAAYHYYFSSRSGGVVVDLMTGQALETSRAAQTNAAGEYVPPSGTAADTDTIIGTDQLTGIENVTGTGLGDRISGDDGNNVIAPGAGNDVIDGRGGIDTIDYSSARGSLFVSLLDGGAWQSGSGAAPHSYFVWDQNTQTQVEVVVRADDELDSYDSLANIENIVGSSFDDVLTGDSEMNVLDGGLGADSMSGGDGGDSYIIDNTGDRAVETETGGVDQVRSSISHALGLHVENLFLTGAAAINGFGNDLNNTILGNAGANTIDGRVGADSMRGGDGNDTYVFDNSGDRAVETATGGTDTVRATVSAGLAANVESLLLLGTAAINGNGNELGNTIIGNAAANVIDGRAGADSMRGGAGNDTYVIDNSGDRAVETATGGVDMVKSSISHSLGAYVEHLVLLGTAAINGTGNDLNNTISGNAGANVIDGRAGGDSMRGGAGNDTYIVDNSGDRAVEGSTGGTDLVKASVSHSLGVYVENLLLTGTAAINGVGNDLNNTIVGNAAANVIDGRAGTDSMRGGAGNDTYIVDNSGDRTVEASTGGVDLVRASVTHTLATYVENLLLTGTANINGTGNTADNVISGNGGANLLSGLAGNDRLSAGAGADTLFGGAGNDLLTGGTGTDKFVFDAALSGSTNVDRITDFSVADDTMLLDKSFFTAFASTGAMAAGAFRTGTGALDADDRVIYDSATGKLYYDADGDGAGAAVLFATVAAGTGLTASDFYVVG